MAFGASSFLRSVFGSFSTVLIASVAVGSPLSPRLEQLVFTSTNGAGDSLVEVVVFLDNNEAAKAAREAGAADLTRSERIRTVTRELQKSKPLQADKIEAFLRANSVTPVVRRWIVPAYTATLPLSKVRYLSDMAGVRRVVENARLSFDAPVAVTPAPSGISAVSDQLTLLKVPTLWARGLDGRGRLVCSFDTGVEGDHPALASKWRGNHAALSATWFSKVSPDSPPSDKAGHGTHTMGVMVGSTAADSFGVAPAAEWISAGVIDQGRALNVTLNDILEAYEWTLNPDGDSTTTNDVPDVILNSWGVPKGLFAPCDDLFTQAINNVEAAGIVCIFAAGNEGPTAMSLRYPADQASGMLNTFAVGAVDNNKVIAGFSSRGPSSCDTTQIKPEITAPGVSVRSSYKDSSYAYMSGTSMAAPYIAGLVALMRQYNPDATVEQLKSALIRSAQDLGAPGEDNAYGHGLPDASKLLDFITPPVSPEISIAATQILGDGVAYPGETFDLQVRLINPPGNVERVVGTITSVAASGVTVIDSEAVYIFGQGGNNAISDVPYRIAFDSTLYHGAQISFMMYLRVPGQAPFDTLLFDLTVGIRPPGSVASHDNGEISLSVSDFGQFGFAPGSIYNLNGKGLRHNGSANLLYEAGIIVGRNSLQLASAVRDSLGRLRPSDFVPAKTLAEISAGSDGGCHYESGMVDTHSDFPIPITISQESVSYPNAGQRGFVIVKFHLKNDSVERLTKLCFGFFVDLDLSGTGERIVFDKDQGLIYQRGESGQMAGLVALENMGVFQTFQNGTRKTGFNRAQMYSILSATGSSVDSTTAGDMFFVASGGPFTLEPNESAAVAFALVAGDDADALLQNAEQAKARYDMSTGIDAGGQTLPGGYALSQNFPNPFNPSTTISFTLPTSGQVSLEVYNLLGQKVKTLYAGVLSAGTHRAEWDGATDGGGRAASGVYLYRLQAGTFSQSRKMVLLK